MDFDNIGNNMNTRVVFREPRGMIRWIQLLMAIVAVSTVMDFKSSIIVHITCPTNTTTSPTTTIPSLTTTITSKTIKPALIPNKQNVTLLIEYPFKFEKPIFNPCVGYEIAKFRPYPLDSSPGFFVFTGFLSIMFCFGTLIIYLIFSNIYATLSVYPLADTIITGILSLFWFVASISFASGLSLLKSTVTKESLIHDLCLQQLAGTCVANGDVSWKSLDVGVTCGFLSIFLWGAGIWFVFKETSFHTPKEEFGPR